MIIEKSTGLVSWIPTTSGKFDVTIEVIDKEINICYSKFTIVVEKHCLLIKASFYCNVYLYE